MLHTCECTMDPLLPPDLLQNEAYMRMMYDQFRTNTNGTYGDFTLLLSAIQERFRQPPAIIINVGGTNELSQFQKIFKCNFVLRIDEQDYKSWSRSVIPLKTVVGCQEQKMWHTYSDKNFCGFVPLSNVLVDQYNLVHVSVEAKECLTLDDVVKNHVSADSSKALVIDTPGSEIDVLQSATITLPSTEYLVVKSYKPSSKMPFEYLYSNTQTYLQSLGYNLTRTIDNDAYTCWSVWTRWMVGSTWYLTIDLGQPDDDLGLKLYKLAAVYNLAKRKGYVLRLCETVSPFEAQFTKKLCTTGWEAYRAIPFHRVVYEDAHQYSEVYFPPHSHIMLEGKFQNNRFVLPHREEFLNELTFNPETDRMSYVLFDCLVQYVITSNSEVNAKSTEVCLVLLDNTEEFIHHAVAKMKQQGAKLFIGCSLSNSKTCCTSVQKLMNYTLTGEMDNLKQNQWMMLLVFRHFSYLILDPTAFSQWIRLIRKDDLSSVKYVEPTTEFSK